jgi:hypothetical protein
MTIRVFPSSGVQTSAFVPPRPAPTQRAYTAGQTASAATIASTATSSAVLTFASGNLPSFMQVGLAVVDSTTPGAITGGQTVSSFNIAAGTVTLSGNVNATVASGDSIVFSKPFVDVPGDMTGDVAAILSSGFFVVGASGPTSARPNGVGGVGHGYTYIDTTLNIVVVWDGANWRNPVDGALA